MSCVCSLLGEPRKINKLLFRLLCLRFFLFLEVLKPDIVSGIHINFTINLAGGSCFKSYIILQKSTSCKRFVSLLVFVLKQQMHLMFWK